ncbi:MAG TPA: hypothetical protein VFY93_11445 [Planctomycetota bacterium]|nr:hypothetical protein [Planctomycetota bacterium]
MIPRTCLAILITAGFAAAQQGSMEEKLREQVAEISRLMRESERLLLEISRVDRLVEAQKQVEEDLKKLLPPEQGGQGGGGSAEERAARRQQLESKHSEISQRLEEMLQGERQRGDQAAQKIQQLLDSLPRQQQMQEGGSGDSKEPKSAEEREKRLREREEQEKKQHQQPQSPRQQRDDPKQRERDERKPRSPEEDKAAAVAKRVEAWIARLPPEDQERINRNDFSRVPIQYRRLVEEYTAQRAKREAEKEPEGDR